MSAQNTSTLKDEPLSPPGQGLAQCTASPRRRDRRTR